MYEVSSHSLNQTDSVSGRIRLVVDNAADGCKISDIISVYDSEVGLHYPLGR